MARTKAQQDKDFAEKLFMGMEDDVIYALKGVFGNDASWVLEWVSEEFEPDDVFDDKKLEAWAEANGFQRE